ncbi:Uncharacterised protein [Mycobacteroides abscessus subsp. massiliense]|uniref:hypothetical protein n=1 Tax=Mycobacteroides abscessus TaxID=36809 RepID=UPI0009A60C7F|nr:hypothetical protein [Mycobacteroides abscessus]SKS10106.1 Uncharacterised protein [Mycobacteroides abscessus subsp. massiliense]
MADDGWPSRNFDEITQKLNGIQAAVAHDLSGRYKAMGAEVSQACAAIQEARNRLNDDRFWSGEGPSAAHSNLDSFYKTVADPDSGLPALADKISQTLDQDADVLTQAHNVPQSHSRPNSKATLEEWNKATEELRADAQRLYTSPLDVQRPKVSDVGKSKDQGSFPGNPGTGGDTGGNTGGGGGGGSQTPKSPSGADALANKDTKPQLAGGDGQQAGAGQGQGQGSGGGQGGGQGSGSGGSGSGSGLGSGLGSGSGGSGLPLGSTTAAGYSPSSTGTGGGGSGTALSGPGGLGGLRGGGLPGGAVSGSGAGGVNPAAVGAAGVRGGPMGMMGGAGAHGRGGKGEEDDDHATPQILINYDNTDEFMGDMPSASPGVIGDWSEQEKAEKAMREREIRRYKALGWDVKFE